MTNDLGILLDNRYFDHRIDRSSPEIPGRLRRLFPEVRERYNGNIQVIVPRQACVAEIAEVHSASYLDQLRSHALKNDPFSYDRDMYLMEYSLLTAQLAAGGCLELADKIMNGSVKRGFALVRPPGHHAEPERGMGSCILNNIAITAKYLLNIHQLDRIMIIDFDIHHGNGTQKVFYDTDKVLFVSLHQNTLFPFTGEAEEIGVGAGKGYNINVPIYSHFGNTEYSYLLGTLLRSLSEQYLPQIILVSAGFGGHAEDSVSSTLLTTRWYHTTATMLKQYARDICGDRLLYVLEGGYNPESLTSSILATIDSLLEPDVPRTGFSHSDRAEKLIRDHPLNEFWNLIF